MAEDRTVEDRDFATVIGDEIRQAQNYVNTELSPKRALATNYMQGNLPDLPSRPNGSSQTSRDVPDTISWILPGVVRVFTASDQMVQFEATQPGGEQAAEEASEFTNYDFFRRNKGYQILRNATYDSLVMGNGVACSYWEPAETKTQIFRDKLPEELVQLMQEEGWQPITQKEGKPRQVSADDGMGGTIDAEMPTFTVKMKRTIEEGHICDYTCKPENLLLNSTATTIEDARFVGYLHDNKTRSDLMEMAETYGWDRSVIEELAADNRSVTQGEVGDARFRDRSMFGSSPLRSGDSIDLYECYIRADMDGDGIAELIQAWYAGNAGQGELLSWDEWEDDVPFTDIPCYPVPHRFDAESVFDRTADIMRVKTVLLRNALDNTYAVNLPMQEVEEGSVLNPDILINRKFGGLIWKKKGSQPIVPGVVPYVADKAFAALEYMDSIIAKRTGVSRTTMALDPEALQNQTATATQQQRDAGYSQIELIARDMAELGWSRFFAKRRNLARKYLQGQLSIPSKNGDIAQNDPNAPQQASKYRTISPENWRDDMAVTINVGLGTGSRDRDMAMLSTIQNDQLMMASMLADRGFAAKAIEFIPKIRKTAVEKAEASGIRNPDDFYPSFTDEDMQKMVAQSQQPPPPPIEILVEQERQKGAQQLAQMNAQITLQTEQGKNQLSEQQARIQAEGDIVKNQAELQADLQTKDADRRNALILEQQRQEFERQKLNAEFSFKNAELQSKMDLEMLKLGQQAAANQQQSAAADGEKAKAAKQPDMSAIMDNLSKALTAPKRIVRDAQGRAIGVESGSGQKGAPNA